MATQLILIEGLPGSGKSTIAKITDEILNDLGIEHQTFREGNLNHPADYEGMACMTYKEFNELRSKFKKHLDFIDQYMVQKENNYFLAYDKIKKEIGSKFPNELLNKIIEYDIYEITLDRHIQLILERWTSFVESALKDKNVYIFECCFIQNPITVSLLRDNSPKEITINYIQKLKRIIEPLNPVLIYVNQNNIEKAFRKVVEERPASWSDGFMYYYTKRGFGKENNMQGLEGTIEVLKSRKTLELELLDALDMDHIKLDNSSYDYNKIKKEIVRNIDNFLKN
ncbi:hypothetical protein GOQ27_10305 [Clostridium sp. D2Q-11]|uniref:Uncharacterized protein n=1 Tax=Anaeromonas frigoriresistens TaxID=2683708 RepID=A0A942UUJ9_9FIRM|nr:hypothetical protein [Anaeromonas frigoriresistens]MBS4538858.1 hypothetical protein [Anaeromonas frigoriresistens]